MVVVRPGSGAYHWAVFLIFISAAASAVTQVLSRKLAGHDAPETSNTYMVLAGFVLSQSYFYASQMLRIGRTSDMAGIPMWIPHGSVALGFALILLIAAWRLVTVITRDADEHSAPADGEVRE